MTELFRPISLYDDVPPSPVEGLERYAPGVLAAGTWTAPAGPPARSGRAGEPLLFDRWEVLGEAPLDDAASPDSLLVGLDVIVVNGREQRGVWDGGGRRVGDARRGPGGSFLDLGASRLLAEHPEGGLSAFALPDGRRDGPIALAFPEGHTLKEVLQGPDALVLVSGHESPFGPPPEVVVEAVRVRDYTQKTAAGILRGLEPLAGIIRQQDGRARAAAAASGPVLAVEDGVLWCDWRLKPLHEQAVTGTPLSLSVDDRGFACLLSDVEGVVHFRVVPPAGPFTVDVELPWGSDTVSAPPLVGASGQIFALSSEAVMAFSPDGPLLWKQARSSTAPATITSNGILLLPDGDLLYAVMPNGRRQSIWQPPAPVATPAVLAGGRIYAATAESLFVLGRPKA